ncbi:MAG: hypothetical protein DIU61_008760 [Bacteroidota bacterium]
MSAHSPYVVELIGEVVNSMRDYPDGEPYYIYDHPMAINQRLIQMSQSIEKKHKRFPLVALRMDFPEEVRGGVLHLNLNLAILDYTSKDYWMEDRYEHVFKPILYPLYDLFIDRLKTSGKFFWPSDQDSPPHIKIDRPYYGTPGNQGNVKNIFTDPLDGIEILNLKINTNLKQC